MRGSRIKILDPERAKKKALTKIDQWKKDKKKKELKQKINEEKSAFEKQDELNEKLIKAIYDEDYNAVLDSLNKGADIEVDYEASEKWDGWGRPLIDASAEGHIKIIKLLIERGADVNITTTNRGTALMAASLYRHLDVVRLLLDNGADVNSKNNEEGDSVLSHTLSPEVAELLIDRGADVNARNKEGITPLMGSTSAIGHHKKIIELLLDKGADVNARDNSGMSALMWGAYLGEQEDKMELLLERGAKVNVRNDRGDTALGIALGVRHYKTAEILRRYGAEE